MASNQLSLDAAATERKARLAKLAALKRKRPENEDANDVDRPVDHSGGNITSLSSSSSTDRYISGRNFDVVTKGPKLGFEQQPAEIANQETVEQEAERIANTVKEQTAREDLEAEKGIDLSKLQPRKPNWDLKRDLAEKMRVVDIKTQNAIARLVRERIEKAKNEARTEDKGKTSDEEGEELGVEGSTLVEAIHMREKEEAEGRTNEDEEEFVNNEGIP